MPYTYDPIFAQDPDNPQVVAANASITIYDPQDPSKTPIAITDPTGSPLPNPITVDARGNGPAFMHPTLDRVAWFGAGFTNYFTAYEGMKDEAVAAREAAQDAANQAATAAADRVTAATVNASGKLILTKGTGAEVDAGSVIGPKGDKGDKGSDGANVLPTDDAIEQAVKTPGSKTATALTATILDKIETSPVVAGKADASAVAAKLDSTVAASTYAKVTDDTDLAFRAIRSALDAGRSTAVQWTGDSTGDSDGSIPTDLRTPSVFMQKIAAKYPGHRVITRKWDDASQDFGAPVVIQEGPAGRRYAQFAGRTMRHLTSTPEQFSTGNLDLRVLVAMDNITPVSASQSLVTRMRKGGVAGPWTNDLQFELRWTTGGLLDFRYSQDGAAWLSNKSSTVAVPATNGVPIWVRAQVDITPGTGYTVKFYTSPVDSGTVWTQLGTTVTGGSAATTAMWTASAGSFFEIGGQSWQPVNNALQGKIYAVQVRDGANGRCMTPCLPEQWERYPDSSTTFGGSPTVHLINASRSGSAMTYHTDATRLPKETPDYGQSVVIFNDSHNEVGVSGPVGWTEPYKAWVDAVTARLPLATVAVVLQNPHTSAWANEAAYGESHKKRLDELRILAGKNRWGIVDLYTAFLKDSRGLAALIQADGLHPTQDGYAVGGQTVSRLAGIA